MRRIPLPAVAPGRPCSRDLGALSGLLLLVVLLLGGAGPIPGPPGAAAADVPDELARVHTALEAASPPEGSTLRRPVTEIRLRFTTEVQLSLSRITLTGPDGPVADGREPEGVEGSEGREIRLALDAPLPVGGYTVEWRTAGPDSHPIRGSYSFRIGRARTAGDTAVGAGTGVDTAGGDPADPDTAPAAAPAAGAGSVEEEGVTPVGIAVRWLFFLSIVGMVGPVAFRALVLPQIGRDEELVVALPRAARGAWRIGAAAGVLAVVVLPARLWHKSVEFFGGAALGAGNLVDLLFRSPWGAAWLMEVGLVVLFVLGLLWSRRDGTGRWGWSVMGIGAVGMCLVPGMSGHAWGAGALRIPALTADALHVLAAGVWMGGLGTLVMAGLPAVRALGAGEALPRLLPALVGAFSRTALVAVALLVGSGLVNAWIHLQSPTQLFTTPYGRTLALKLGVVAGAMALGFYNWRVVRPSLEESPRPGLIRIPATVEFVLGLIALAAAAVLVATSPPG